MKNNKNTPKTNKKSSIKKILSYIKPYRFSLVMSLLLALISAVSALFIPVLAGKAIDCIIKKGNVDFQELKNVLLTLGISALISALSGWLQSIFNNKIVYKVVRDLRHDAFEKIQELPISYLDSHQSGEIVSKIISDADAFAEGLLMGFSQFFTGIVTIVGTIVFMLTISPSITLAVVVITPLSLIVASFIAKKTYNMFKDQSLARAEQTALINEVIGNQKLVKAFSMEDEMQKSFDVTNEKLKKCSLKAVFFSSLTNPSTRFVNALVYALVGMTGAFAVVGTGLTVGGLSSFLGYASSYTKPFNEISGVIAELQGALASAERILEFIELESESDGKILEGESESSGQDSVEFKNVSFSYDKSRSLLENISLKAEKGQRIAIVGPTGCGKTTLINLLMRFYDIDSGDILINGENIKCATRKETREHFGMVLQDTWLKSGTVKENIAMSKPNATDEEIISAAKRAHAHSFIKRLPRGYDTLLCEDGGELSQGEKQLLCIARVMLSSPPMLILDEATSSIDTRTEIRIQKAFAALMEGRISFVVAHRLSTIKNSDLILVMKDGNIIEKGKHDELMEMGGFYKELYNKRLANAQ